MDSNPPYLTNLSITFTGDQPPWQWKPIQFFAALPQKRSFPSTANMSCLFLSERLSLSLPIEATVPMSERSFPPSFWNINHQPVLTAPAHHHSSHTSSSSSSGLCLSTPGTSSAAQVHELYADAYHHTGGLHPSIHHQNDPWHYTLSASATANPYSHHHHHHRTASAIHDLSYTSASNRFNAQYGSLLLQPASMRSSRLPPVSGACQPFDKTAGDMSWPASARYHHEASMNFGGHHTMDPTNYSASAAYGAAMSAAMSGMRYNQYNQL